MLVLSRKPGEEIKIDGGITIKIVDVRGGNVRVGITAPDEVGIVRAELDTDDEPSVPTNGDRDRDTIEFDRLPPRQRERVAA